MKTNIHSVQQIDAGRPTDQTRKAGYECTIAPIETGEHRPALVLNADFRPLSYYPLSLWSWQDTIKAVCQDKVVIVEEYDEQIASPSVSMTLPSVIASKTTL